MTRLRAVSGASLGGIVRAVLVCAVLLGVAGCSDLRRILDFERQEREARALCRVQGRIETEAPVEGVLVVVLGRLLEGGTSGEAELVGVDSYVRTRPGSYVFAVAPGRFQVGAYEDRNRNGLLDPGERALQISTAPILEVGPGESVRFDMRLGSGDVIEGLEEPIDVLGLVERTPAAQREFSLWALSAQGRICDDLMDPRFGPEAGLRGLWEPMDFLNEGLAGIYFLEPYDDDRVPVLFVHGISGHPREFATLIAGLDHERFQPWFYFYPSGFPLDGIARHLAGLTRRLHVQYGFDDIAIVAHSMGGLVARGAIFDYETETGREDIRFLLTLATPWGGQASAANAENARFTLPGSFVDMSPSSEYLRWLFYEDDGRTLIRSLPDEVESHLILAYRMTSARDRADDGRVSLQSQARLEAQDQAASVRALDYDHAGILHAPEVVDRMNRLLRERFD